MKVREIIAEAVGSHDNDKVPDGYADPCDLHHVSDWSMWLSDKTIAALDAAGFFIVPKEPTEAMVERGANIRTTIQIDCQAMSGHIGEWPAKDCYRAMLTASQPKEASNE
jgi:hypothetical protein